MDKDLSDISLSFINLYEEFIYYLIENKKLSVSKAPIRKQTKIGKYIREKNKTKERLESFIKYFEQVIRDRFPDEMLHNFEDNLEDFKIYGICFQLGDIIRKLEEYDGKYQPKKNIIIINIKNPETILSIYHELFHMSSSNRMIVDHFQTGFYSFQNGNGIGKGLNEGYTDLLAYRYFGSVGSKIGYPLEFQYSYALEKIVGRERMENLYMSSNPNQLVRELERYDSIDNILHLIKLFDEINNPKDNLVARSTKINSITSILIQWYARKLFLDGKNISDPVVQRDIYSYAYQLPEKIYNLDGDGSFKININIITKNVIDEFVMHNSNMNRRF